MVRTRRSWRASLKTLRRARAWNLGVLLRIAHFWRRYFFLGHLSHSSTIFFARSRDGMSLRVAVLIASGCLLLLLNTLV